MPQVITAVVGIYNTIKTWYGTLSALAQFAVQTAVVFGVSKIMANRALGGLSQGEGGARVQLPPATNNALPVIYGRAYVAPVITDAKISTDQKFMWYVCSLSEYTETTPGSVFTFGDIYWNGNLINGVTGASSNVTSWTNNAGQTDYKMAGKIQIYKFPNGSTSGTNTGGLSAIEILSDQITGGGIQPNLRWDSGLYTDPNNTKSADMTNTCFLVVRVEYNQDAGTTGLGTLTVELTNSVTKPGDVILDYMLNTRYGCAIPPSRIDTASLTDLNTYSDQTITYTDIDSNPATQARYRVNGPVNVTNTCLTNLQQLADNCDSWLQYSDIEDKWKMVINKPYDVAPNAVTTANLYHVKSGYDDTDANLVGGINVNPIDLNSTYNSLQVAYPNENINDQTDYQIFDFTDATTAWYNPGLLSPNEPANKLDVDFPQVNNYIQSAYLGVRRLLQSREDLVISFQTDYSGIQVEAGDVIRITSEDYGWDLAAGFPDGKLFRVAQVDEIKDDTGNLFAKIQAFEYNSTIYADNALTDFVPALNTGLEDPNVIGIPPIPTAAVTSDGALATLRITATIPNGGITQFLDFNYGLNSDPSTHELYRTVSLSSGNPFTQGSTYTIDINDLPPATYYFSIVARNDRVGQIGGSSGAIVWAGTNVNPITYYYPQNCSSSGTTITCDPIGGLLIGGFIFVTPGSGTGEFAAGTTITQVNSPTEFIVSATPTIALSGGVDCRVEYGGLPPNSVGTVQIVDLAVVSDKMADLAIIESKLADDAVARAKLLDGAVDSVKLATAAVENLNIAPNAVTEVKIDNDSISAPKIKTNAVTTDKIDTNAVTAGKILAGTIDATRISTGTLTSASGVFGVISADNVSVGTLNGSTVNVIDLNASSIVAGTFSSNVIYAGNIAANQITSGKIATARLDVDDIVVTGGILVTGGNVTANGNGGVTQITGDVITTGTVDAAYIDVSGVITVGSLTTGAGVNANVTSISGNSITTGEVNGTLINADTLNVKHFADVSVDIINQTGGTVPLRVQAKNSQWNGTFVGSQINSVEAVYMNTTTPNIRNGATYQVIYSAVLGNTRVGTIEYSYNQSTWVSLGGVGQGTTSMNTDAGNNYRTYVFAWQGQLTGMTSAQQTVYWRVKWNNFGSQFNSTYQSIYIDIDNTT